MNPSRGSRRTPPPPARWIARSRRSWGLQRKLTRRRRRRLTLRTRRSHGRAQLRFVACHPSYDARMAPLAPLDARIVIVRATMLLFTTDC